MPIASATKRKVVKKASTPKVGTKVPGRTGAFAIIETGGKQYRVAEGDVIKIEKIKGNLKEGSEVAFDKVHLLDVGEGGPLQLGTPYLMGAKVIGTITGIGRNKKVIVIHYKQKSRYFKKQGHRQPYFKVRIDSIK